MSRAVEDMESVAGTGEGDDAVEEGRDEGAVAMLNEERAARSACLDRSVAEYGDADNILFRRNDDPEPNITGPPYISLPFSLGVTTSPC